MSNKTERSKAQEQPPDPILAMRGLGKELWRELGGAEFIRGLRSGWPARKLPSEPPPARPPR